jgi:hypothetical protein
VDDVDNTMEVIVVVTVVLGNLPLASLVIAITSFILLAPEILEFRCGLVSRRRFCVCTGLRSLLRGLLGLRHDHLPQKGICLLALILLQGCIVQQPASQVPTAQEIARQIEQDYANTPPATPTPEAASTPSPDTEVTYSDDARNQAMEKIQNLTTDQAAELVATTLENRRDYLKANGHTEEAGIDNLVAAWARDEESIGSQQLTLMCTEDNIEWFDVIAKQLKNIADTPWTVAIRGDLTEQEMADQDADDYFTAGFLDELVKQCNKINQGQTHHHRHHRSALPKGTHEL